MRILLLTALLLPCLPAFSVEKSPAFFSVFPSECIASQKGEVCILPITLTYPEMSSSEQCLHINNRLLGCWLPDQLPTKYRLELEADSTLTLKSGDDGKAPSVMLKVKYRKASTHRRRVRNPWSLF